MNSYEYSLLVKDCGGYSGERGAHITMCLQLRQRVHVWLGIRYNNDVTNKKHAPIVNHITTACLGVVLARDKRLLSCN